MRVLVVTHMYPSPSNPESGVFVRDQVEALRACDGIDVEVRSFPRGKRSYPRAAWRLRGSAERGQFDVVHAHYGLSGLSALTTRAPRLVVTFHGTDLRHPVVRPLSRLVARLADLPATVSAALARERMRGAGSRRRVAVLPCGVDTARFRPLDRRQARGRLGLDGERPLLLFPADPARAVKRYDRARALAARVPDARLLTLGGVPPAEVPLWINAANAVLVTSESESFGLAVLEALACDVPVLATPVGIAPLILGDLGETLCAPVEDDRWLALLRTHVEAPDPRVRGRGRAELFSSKRMAARVATTYRELAQTAA